MLLTGCSETGYRAPIDSLEQPPSQKITAHIVAKGETLYAIAWRYSMDTRALARANGIAEPYLIHPGQRLTLDLRHRSRPPSAEKTNADSPVRISNRSNKRSTSRTVPESPAAPVSALRWQWPANGAIINVFSGAKALNKGIDIGAKKGEPVVAAESGTVVYAGNGLRGYGNLLIIKHNQNYLSAYAHNNKLLVVEGHEVKAGQHIAEVGSSGTNIDKLHFEIRRDGTPVDPMRYLPPR